MAAAVTYDFVEKLSEECTCAICTSVLTDPVLTGCCGQEFCQSCLLRWLERNNTCPHCRSGEIKHMKNLKTKRAIDDLRVYCPNKARGCKEVVTIGSYNDHLGKCLFVKVKCKLKCGAKKIRKSIEQHELNECQNREVKCQYCGTKGMYKDITTEKHIKVCPCFPLPCPNECGVTGIQRQNIPAHKETCPLEPVECSFAEAGCEVKPARKDLDQHLAESTGYHLALVSGVAVRATQKLAKVERQLNDLKTSAECTTKQFNELTTCVEQELSEMTPDSKNAKQIATIRTALTTMMEPDTRYCLRLVREDGNAYKAPSFYIQPGYKMRVNFYSTIFGGLCSFCLLPGDYDDQVPWPIPNNIEIVLESEYLVHLEGPTRLTIPLCDKCDRGMDLSRVREESREINQLVCCTCQYIPRDHFYLYITIREHKC